MKELKKLKKVLGVILLLLVTSTLITTAEVVSNEDGSFTISEEDLEDFTKALIDLEFYKGEYIRNMMLIDGLTLRIEAQEEIAKKNNNKLSIYRITTIACVATIVILIILRSK